MKSQLIAIVAAVLVVGCGESQQSTPQAEPVEPVAVATQPEPTTAKEPNISILEAVVAGNIAVVKQHLADKTYHENFFDFARLLNVAVSEGHKEIAELLISEGVGVGPGFSENPLNLAVLEGHKEIAELLISKGADVNAKDGWGRTPLHRVITKGRKETAELLIAEGADVNAKDGYGETPLDYAEDVYEDNSPEVKAARKETADLLRKHGGKTGEELAKPEPPTAKAPDISIHDAALIGNIEAVKQHLAAGTDVNAKDFFGCTPLHFAAETGVRKSLNS